MSIYRLVIKGGIQAARTAAERNGIPGDSLKLVQSYRDNEREETTMQVELKDDSALVKWYAEDYPESPPFKAGSLLMYGTKEETDEG